MICYHRDVHDTRNERHKPVRRGVFKINGENYWPVKLKHRSTGHIK